MARSISSLLLGVTLLLLGSGLLNTLLAIRGGLEGFTNQTMGFVMSGYFFGFFIGTFFALPMIRRVGHIRAFAVAAAIASVSSLMHQVIIDPWAWAGLRVLTGMSLVVLYTTIEGWLNSQTPTAQRGQVFAIYMVVNLGALTLAQQLLSFGEVSDYVLFAIASMLITLSLVPVAWTRRTPPEVNQVRRLSIPFLWRIAPIAVAGGLLSGLAMGAFWGMGAVYASNIGLSTAEVAAFITATILGGALLQFPVGRLSDKFDRRKVLMISAIIAGFSALLIIPMAMLSGWYLLIAMALYGGFAFSIYPIAIAHVIDHLEGSDILAGGSALLLLHGVGAAIGPALAGTLMDFLGSQSLLVYFWFMQWLLAVVAFLKMRERVEDKTLGDAAHFMPMVRTTAAAFEMHPDENDTGVTTDSELSQSFSEAQFEKEYPKFEDPENEPNKLQP
ncbi:MAG: MFS transporter [Oleibacter sp.]|nr:MFS transporter [Thalassolituus sp.]